MPTIPSALAWDHQKENTFYTAWALSTTKVTARGVESVSQHQKSWVRSSVHLAVHLLVGYFCNDYSSTELLLLIISITNRALCIPPSQGKRFPFKKGPLR